MQEFCIDCYQEQKLCPKHDKVLIFIADVLGVGLFAGFVIGTGYVASKIVGL